MSILNFLSNFLKKIGDIFTSLAKGAEKVWGNTEPVIQDALLKASGLVAIINKYVSEDPLYILAAIRQKYPELTDEKLKEISDEVTKSLNLAQDGVTLDLAATIQNIANYLKEHSGSKWAKLSEDIAGTIAIFLAPTGTPWNKIGTILWFVYQRFIKGKI